MLQIATGAPHLNIALNGFTDCLKLLIQAGCVQTNDGSTPLYIKAFFGHSEITEQVIEAHTNLDLQHENGYTPLMIAAYCGHAAVATLLLVVTLMSRRWTSILQSLEL